MRAARSATMTAITSPGAQDDFRIMATIESI
jgi:hypothetical protein